MIKLIKLSDTHYIGGYSKSRLNKKSITNTFEETYNKLKI